MTRLTLVISIILPFIFTGQTVSKSVDIKIKEYNSDGLVLQESIKNFETKSNTLDLYFFRNKLQIPFYLPDSFTSKTFKSQTIINWRDEKGEKDYKENWSHTFIYDSLYRVIGYSYSGCLICSNMPYNYRVVYNKAGQITEINNITIVHDSFVIYYDTTGSIRQIDVLNSNILTRSLIVAKK